MARPTKEQTEAKTNNQRLKIRELLAKAADLRAKAEVAETELVTYVTGEMRHATPAKAPQASKGKRRGRKPGPKPRGVVRDALLTTDLVPEAVFAAKAARGLTIRRKNKVTNGHGLVSQ